MMFDTLCAFPLKSDLFDLSLHPSAALAAAGLSSGYLDVYQLPKVVEGSTSSDASEGSEKSDGRSMIDLAWSTKRHKGSCRAVAFGHDGEQIYSAGTDGIVKGARSEDGTVNWKIAVPRDPSIRGIDQPCLLHALTPQTLLLGTDSSALHLYDIRTPSKSSPGSVGDRPSSTYHPHDDYISSLTPLPPTEASTSGLPKQWITTGGTTLAVTDLRRGVLVRSEDQEEELLSSCLVSGLSSRGTSTGTKAVVGGADGVLTLWEKGVWDDQDERITVDRARKGGGDSLDCVREVPRDLTTGGLLAVGMGGGGVRFVKLGSNKVVGEVTHDEVEGVVALDFDVGGRMITGGGSILKVWAEKAGTGAYDPETQAIVTANGKRGVEDDSDDEEAEGDDSDDSSEEEKPKHRRKKRKRNRGKAQLNGKANPYSFGDMD